MKNLFLIIVLTVFLSSTMLGCNNTDTPGGNDNSDELRDLPIMTMEEVSQNDGKDGRNAYIVVNGIVYDVTNSRRWSGGSHNGFQAGQDLTDEILRDSPHGKRVLSNITAIGRIEE